MSIPVGSESTNAVDPLLVLQWNEKRSRAPVQQINYLKHISIAKHLITWNTKWMLLKMCRFLYCFSPPVRMAVLKPWTIIRAAV